MQRTDAPGFEPRDIRPRVVLGAAIALLVALVLTLVLVTVFETLVTGVPPSLSRPADLVDGLRAATAPTPAAPRLDAESGSAAAYRAAAEAKLDSYRWVDRQGGVVAIPIDRAMELVAQPGALPARAAGEQRATAPTNASSARAEGPYP
jgi:hypothetical protein